MTGRRTVRRIGVLAGGASCERGISLMSGEAVFSALKSEGCDVIFIDIQDHSCGSLKDLKIDVAFIALHGKYGEDGTVQNALENLGIPYTGSGKKASQLALDKPASRMIFAKNGIKIPQYMVINRSVNEKDILDRFKIPFVIKPKSEGSSIGLSIVRRASQTRPALEEVFRYGDEGMAEEFIGGRELTVGIFDDKPLPVIEIMPKEKVYDYKAKYEDGRTGYVVPAPINKETYREAQMLGLRAHSLLGCRDFSRVDMMMDAGGKIYVLEVNSIPGLTERSLLPKAAKAQGIGFNKLCVKLVELALNHGTAETQNSRNSKFETPKLKNM